MASTTVKASAPTAATACDQPRSRGRASGATRSAATAASLIVRSRYVASLECKRWSYHPSELSGCGADDHRVTRKPCKWSRPSGLGYAPTVRDVVAEAAP